jgi:hypothetical protein
MEVERTARRCHRFRDKLRSELLQQLYRASQHKHQPARGPVTGTLYALNSVLIRTQKQTYGSSLLWPTTSKTYHQTCTWLIHTPDHHGHSLMSCSLQNVPSFRRL